MKAYFRNPGDMAWTGPVDLDFEGIKAIVGGWVESIRLGDATLLVNEEGKLQQLGLTAVLTDRAGEIADLLVGPVVMAGPVDDAGELMDADAASVACAEFFLTYPFHPEIGDRVFCRPSLEYAKVVGKSSNLRTASYELEFGDCDRGYYHAWELGPAE